MLIMVKMLVDQCMECRPIDGGQMMLYGLQPTLGSPSEVHGGHMNPHGRLYNIHFEVVGSTSDPKLSMVAIEFGEIEFGKVTQVCGIELGGGNRHGGLVIGGIVLWVRLRKGDDGSGGLNWVGKGRRRKKLRGEIESG